MDESQYIYGTKKQELEKTKEVKMRIPVGHLIRLHSLKLLAGQNISETVAKALEVYFEKVDADKRAARASEQDRGPQLVEDSTF